MTPFWSWVTLAAICVVVWIIFKVFDTILGHWRM